MSIFKDAAAILLVTFCLTSSVRAECENGWISYKDESCIKAFTDLLTYDEAKYFCASQENADSTATLVIVKEAEMQEMLASYTETQFDNFWLGGRFDIASAKFKWEDGDPLTYTNWAEGYPRNNTDSDSCIQFIPANAKTVGELEGKWQDTVCQRRNLAMCQRELAWSLKDATREIRKLRKEVEAVNSRVVPVGSIYVEYYNQPSPVSLWPTLSWEEVTSSYAGLFFRAQGGGSGNWGETQADCSPRITETRYSVTSQSNQYTNPLALPSEGWSGWGCAGFSPTSSPYNYDVMAFNVKNCEVRPSNQAVRIWRRLG